MVGIQWSLGRLLAALLLASVALLSSQVAAQVELPQLKMRLTEIPQQVAAQQQGVRVAELLVDCSSSMGFLQNPQEPASDANTERWGLVRAGLEKCIRELLTASPGVEVRVRFFASRYECLPSIYQTLREASDVERIMAAIPQKQPNKGGTLLFESIFKTSKKLMEEHAARKFEWLGFVVFSDGEDDTSDFRFRKGGRDDFGKAVEQMLASIPTSEARALIVGVNVVAFANAGGFGPLGVGQLGAKIPTPPKPVDLFKAELDQSSPASPAGVAKPGRYRVPVLVELAQRGALPGAELRVELTAPGAFRLVSTKVECGTDGRCSIDLELPAGADASAGAVLVLRVTPVSKDPKSARFVGGIDFPITFSASATLPPDQWVVSGLPPHARVNSPIALSVAAGKLGSEPKWTLAPAGGQQAVTALGAATTVQLPIEGDWKVSIDADSDSQRRLTRQAGVIKAVDADFEIVAPTQRAQVGRRFTIGIKRKGTSAAKWSARLDSEEVPVSVGAEPQIEVPADLLSRPGLRRLSVQARSELGGYEWSRQIDVDVDVSPQISIVNADYIEGEQVVDVELLVTGDVGGSLLIAVDGADARTVKVDDAAKVRSVGFQVPRDSLKSSKAKLSVQAANKSCELQGEIRGVGAQIGLAMRDPLDGSRITADGRTERGAAELVLEPIGADFDRFVVAGSTAQAPRHDLEFEIRYSRGDGPPTGSETGFIARGPSWTVGLPADPNPGAVAVWARARGARLLPAIFPSTSAWKQIGTLQVSRIAVRIEVVGADGKGISPDGAVVVPGNQISLRAVGPSQQDVQRVNWSFGPLPGDPILGANAVQRESTADTESIVPAAWGTLPIKAQVFLRRNNAALEPATVAIVVRGKSPTAQPNAPESVSMAEGVATQVGAFEVMPRVTGDFMGLTVEVHERFDPSGSSEPLWKSVEFPKDPGTVQVPTRREDGGRFPSEVDVVFRVRSYPGDPAPLDPISRRVRFLLPSLKIVALVGEGKSVPVSESEFHPGEERTVLLSGVALTERDSVEWEIGPLAEDPDLASAQRRDVGSSASLIIRPQACGVLPLKAKVRMADGTQLEASDSASVVAEPPTAAPALPRSRITEGTKAVELALNAKGRFRALQVLLYPRGGAYEGAKPLWSSQKFGSDPGRVDVPLELEDGSRAPAQFEVAVIVEEYPGCVGISGKLHEASNSSTSRQIVIPGTIVPAPRWIEYILTLLGLMAVTAWLWNRLARNEPMRWTLEFAFRDPGPPGRDQPYQLDVGPSRESETVAGQKYAGWSRRHKHAYVPLWALAEAAGPDSSNWLNEAEWARLNIHVVGYWNNPFHRLPGPEEGWANPEEPYAEVDGDGDERFSRTIVISSGRRPGQPLRRIWIRMRCPRGLDPLIWVFWTWLGVAIAAAVSLLFVLHIA
jgi:hypothetical protein